MWQGFAAKIKPLPFSSAKESCTVRSQETSRVKSRKSAVSVKVGIALTDKRTTEDRGQEVKTDTLLEV